MEEKSNPNSVYAYFVNLFRLNSFLIAGVILFNVMLDTKAIRLCISRYAYKRFFLIH